MANARTSPRVLQDQDIDVTRIRVQGYPAREQDGLIWVYFAADAKSRRAACARRRPRYPSAARMATQFRAWSNRQIFPCEVDHAVVGLMDPAHGPFVHQGLVVAQRKVDSREGQTPCA